MTDIALRDATERDFGTVVALNSSEVEYTSPMDELRLRHLHSMASYHKVATVAGTVAAFLLAMKDGCGYVNENYEWFAARYDSFLYVDRIVVRRAYQGLKLGTLLYKDLFEYAKAHDIGVIVCEYNIEPPNEPSRAFHDRFGFREIGSRWLTDGSKRISYQVAEA